MQLAIVIYYFKKNCSVNLKFWFDSILSRAENILVSVPEFRK